MKKFLLFLILSSPAWGQVTFDAATNGACGNGGTACTGGSAEVLDFLHTTGAGSNRAMLVGCTVAGSSGTVEPIISTVTYAGVSLTQLVKRDANYDTYIWQLPSGTQPTSGSNHVIVTAGTSPGAPDGINCTAATFAGVDQTTSITVSDCTGAGTSATASCTLSASGANDMVVATECNGTSIGTPTGALTRRAFSNNANGACDSNGLATAAGNTTAVSWNNNGNDTWQILAVALKAASGASPAMGKRKPVAF